mmetsp:Transcript_898/g.3267  ORF Transcript_898/g.3267 Transcript_898/m.3267 type:complete len:376 (+) Transcript_898:52-1179(+)
MSAPEASEEQQLYFPLATHNTEWRPQEARVALNVALDAKIVPSGDSLRLDFSRLVVLDNFFGETERAGLLRLLFQPSPRGNTPHEGHEPDTVAAQEHAPDPPECSWERRTSDQAGLPESWGLKDWAMESVEQSCSDAVLEVQSRLCKLYPEFEIARQPPILAGERMAGNHEAEAFGLCSIEEEEGAKQDGASELREHTDMGRPRQGKEDIVVKCGAFVANAAVYGDVFRWHVDADPTSLAPSPWTERYGYYFNRERGKPLFVSLLLYLNKEWALDNDAETLFLDNDTATGVFVRPKAYRAVLMDQDVVHRLSTPSMTARRPRYSLVWKLVFVPKSADERMRTLARPEWGSGVFFGSAAHADEALEQERKKKQRTQ